MTDVRRARAPRANAPRRVRVPVALALSAVLALCALGTPAGAAAASPPVEPPSTPAEQPSTPPEQPDGTVAEQDVPAAPSPTPSATPAPSPTAETEPAEDAVDWAPTPEASEDLGEAADDGAADAVKKDGERPDATVEDERDAPPSAGAEGDAAANAPPAAPSARAPPAGRVGILAAGVPEAPRQVWGESFEQGLATTAPSGLTAYASGRYTASSGWSSGTSCTGVLVNFTAAYPNASFCPTQTVAVVGQSSLAARETRRIADVLGQLAAGVPGGTTNSPANGSTTGASGSQSNHALVGMPATTVSGGTTVAQSASPIGVTASGSRFYALRFDAAGAQCTSPNAALSMSLFSGSTTLLAGFPSAVVPCAASGSVFYTSPAQATLPTLGGILDPAISASARAATYTGTTTALLTGAQIAAAQVRVTNATTGGGGAFGVDNLRVLDVSPALDASFSPSPAIATTPTTLTYTVTNTSDLLAKTDWSFSANLPTGLVVAPAPGVGGTCTNVAGTAFAVTAAAGSGSIGVAGGDLASGSASCTVTVNVVAAAAGTFSSGTVTSNGLVVSPAASLTVQPATTITVRKDITARNAPGDQFTLSVRNGSTVLGSATTSGTAVGIQPAQVGPLTVTAGGTVTIHETPTTGAGLGYSASYECVRDGTVIAAGTSPSGSLTLPTEQGAQVVCTFVNTPQATQLQCDTNHYYALTGDGALVQGDIVTGASATVGTWNTGTNANGLGISPGGTVAYALQRSTDATDVSAILKWTPTAGFQTLAGTAYTSVVAGAETTGSLVAGAVDPRTGRYVFGKYSGSAFHLWSFTESAPTASRFSYLGSFATTGSPDGNGDLAFDSRGNLYVLGAAVDANGQSSAVIFTITAESIAAANGGTFAVGSTNSRTLTGLDATPAFGAANGLAFSPRGTAYVSSATVAYEFDATTWARIPGSSRTTVAHTDLASCTSPSSITVLKNVIGRAAAADQFTLSLANGGVAVASTTTAGSATGRQGRQIGPLPASVGAAFTFTETMATGATSTIGVYTVVNECWADGVRLSNAASPSGQVTIPNRQSVNVVCTIFNSPRPATSVTLTKLVADPVSGATSPAADWTLGTSALATVGTATVLPSEAPRQQTDASGRAVWSVLFGSTASRATLTVSEEQRTGYVFDRGSCTVNGTATPVTFTTAGSVVSASLPGIASGGAVACTIVNRPAANLTLAKTVSFGSALPSDWVLSATAPTGSTALPGPRGRSGTGAVSSVPVTPGIAYRLSETGPRATYVQTGAWRCVDQAGSAIAVTTSSDVILPAGANATCTVTNATAAITVVKEVEGAADGFRPADWTITATPDVLTGSSLPTETRVGAAFAAGGNPASTFDVRPGHRYTLSEDPTRPGSRLAYQTLRLERLTGSTWTPVTSPSIVAPAPGQSAVYRFVNAPVQPTTLPLTGGVGADAFTLAGGGMLALLVIFAFLRAKRRREPM